MVATAQPRELTLELDDVQGILLRGYGEKRHACFLLVYVDDAGPVRDWLATVPVTTAENAARGDADDQAALREARHREDAALNVAISAAGLRALSVPDDVLRRTFAHAFAEGLASERAQHITNDPPSTRWSWSDERVHLVVMVYASTAPGLERAVADVASALGDAVRFDRLDTAELSRFEHFGFRDGVAQPKLLPETDADATPLGEFILGYPDSHREGRLSHDDVRYNGSYLVMRQLRQDVRAFWEYMACSCAPCPPGRTSAGVALAAKMIGRWPSGEPLVRTVDRDPGRPEPQHDAFGFRHVDDEGERCPLGSHIRRMNPRDWLFGPTAAASRKVTERHRLLRRGRAYGESTGMTAEHMSRHPESIPDAPRGLHFLCFQSDIHRQFEFVQQTWANNPKFAGLCTDPDPIIGQFERRNFTVQKMPVRHRARDLPRFVELKGGGYFFLPGRRGLREIALVLAR